MVCGIINITEVLNVKMTMLFDPLSLILPHYCCSCGVIGAILCEGCYYDIVSEPNQRCLACQRPFGRDGRCSCRRSYGQSWCVGPHEGNLKALVAVSKFDSARAGCDRQAELLNHVLPELPSDVVVVPVPTIARHVRQRGYGHAERIARQLAKHRKLSYQELFARTSQLVQHGATRSARTAQARRSYRLAKQVQPGATYLIVDDVYTTGATIDALASLLRGAGVKTSQIWVAVTTRQPTDAS